MTITAINAKGKKNDMENDQNTFTASKAGLQ
jgi:hypothetical protein